jgi:hypothetical protein
LAGHSALSQINPRAVVALHEGASRMLWSGAWYSLFSPLLAAPAWSAPPAVALLLLLISGMQPGRG